MSKKLSTVRVPAKAQPKARAKPAPKAPVPNMAPVMSGPAPLVVERVEQVAAQYAALAALTEEQSGSFVIQTRLLGLALGMPITYRQFEAQVKPALVKALEPLGMADKRRDQYVTRFRVIVCAALTGDVTLAPQPGEGRDRYMTRIRAPLDAFVFSDGTPMVAVNPVTGKTSKRGPKPGSTAKNKGVTKGAATNSAGKAETPTNAPAPEPTKTAALNLTRQNSERAERLLVILRDHGAAFDAWSIAYLAEVQAKLDAAKAPPKAPPAPKAPPVTAIAAALAKAQANGAKPNGAAN